MEARPVRLRDGSTAVTRPISPADAPCLTAGLRRLSPTGHAYRFLHYRTRFTEAELHYLTHCDFIDHLALVFAPTDAEGREVDGVGVARCIRTKEDPETAEVAIVFVDEWQRRGAGTVLLRHLADLALSRGIRRWKGFLLEDNQAALKLLAKVGKIVSTRRIGAGALEAVCELNPSGAVIAPPIETR